MQLSRLTGGLAWLVMLGVVVAAQPASARRTVIDTGPGLAPSGYCSPNDCTGFTTAFSVQIGSTSYNTFYANSNGTLSFGSIWWPYLAQQEPYQPFLGTPYYTETLPPQTSLGAYPVPIFSPNFSDGAGYENMDGTFDGNFIADSTVAPSSFAVSWYACNDSETCGPSTAALVLSASFVPDDFSSDDLQALIMDYSTATCPCTPEQVFASGQQNYANVLLNVYPRYTMTLTSLPSGFSVNYSYTQGALGQTGTYGFSVPSGLDQTTGPLQNQTYFFDSLGELLAVPEPVTWMTMLLGFGAIGLALRRGRRLQQQAA